MARHSLTPFRSSLAPFRGGRAMSNDPFQMFQVGMNRLFDDVFSGTPMAWGSDAAAGEVGMLMPQMNVSETDKEILITAELPGVSEKDVDITLDDNLLTISGEKKSEKKDENENYHCIERSFGRFQRSLRMSHAVNPDEVQATFENGILTIRLPKDEEQERVRHIHVQSGGSSKEGSGGSSSH